MMIYRFSQVGTSFDVESIFTVDGLKPTAGIFYGIPKVCIRISS